MLDEEKIMKKYVWNESIYLKLMSGNISNSDYSKENRLKANLLIQEMVAEGTDELIDNLLQIENWRARLIAGCLIGFKNRRKYIPQIGQNLLNGCGGVTGYCYAFARFADEESINYLREYLDTYLLFDKFPDEKFQDWVFSALRWTDKINKTTNSNSYLEKDGLWYNFVNFDWNNFTNFKHKKVRKLADHGKWNLKKADKRFEIMMNYYQENFEKN